jgi:hypothetical protein
MKFEYLFWVFFIAILANILWKFFRNGSFTCAMLGGRIIREIGEVPLAKGSLSSQVLRVLELESTNGEKFLGLSVVSKAPLAASMTPYRLTRDQAKELIALLQKASGAQGAA